jgi:hypothetical protein
MLFFCDLVARQPQRCRSIGAEMPGVHVARRVESRLRTRLGVGISLALASAGAFASERWADYAVASLMPDYEWAESKVEAPTLLDARRAYADIFASTVRLSITEHTTLSIASDRGIGGATLGTNRVRGGDFASRGEWNGLERHRLTADLEQSFSDQSRWSAGVVLVHQSYATAGLAGARAGLGQTDRPLAGFEQLSYGTGVRVGMMQPLSANLWLDAEFRSRVDMDALLGYRGLYGEPGDFDLPATGSAALGVAAGPRSEFSFGVSRVMYSGVAPFTSNLLPTRLLALLGDGTSPTFRWRDLTVYSVDWSWRPAPAHRVTLHYSTSLQPTTTSDLLSRALASERDGYNLGGTYAFESSGGSSLRLGVLWSPVSYLHGHSLRQRRDLTGPLLEVEAAWTVPF